MDIKRFRQLIQGPESQVFLRALGRTDIGPVEIAPRPKLLLRPTSLFAQAAHDFRDDVDRLAGLHRPQDRVMMRIALQGIPSILEC